MRSFSPVILLILVLLASSGDGRNTGKVCGVVSDAASGCPLQGARVWISGTQMETFSDIKGYYWITGVPPGTYTIGASTVRYNDSEKTDVRVIVDLATNLSFGLRAQGTGLGTIAGVVADSATENPLPGAEVCWPYSRRRGGCVVLEDGWLRSDETGRYSIPRVAPGTYRLRARSQWYIDSRWARVFVAAKETTLVDFSLCPKRGYFGIITGVVTDSVTWKPLPAVSITRIPIPLYNTDDFESVRSDTSGKYNIPGAFAGTHMLVASRQGYTTTRIADVLVEADEVSEVSLSLRPHPLPDTLGRICGIVVDASTCEPLSYANVYIHDVSKGCKADPFGFYCIRNVRPGMHTVTARRIGHATVEAPNVQALAGQTTILNFKMLLQPIKFK